MSVSKVYLDSKFIVKVIPKSTQKKSHGHGSQAEEKITGWATTVRTYLFAEEGEKEGDGGYSRLRAHLGAKKRRMLQLPGRANLKRK
ncbi:hypothetical protein KSD_71830 [Ktedonobacter sp. SOSP1-85]|nr:hypothetical protein KSD_71830 [Ktedonobacter sp. SOSP1-85]